MEYTYSRVIMTNPQKIINPESGPRKTLFLPWKGQFSFILAQNWCGTSVQVQKYSSTKFFTTLNQGLEKYYITQERSASTYFNSKLVYFSNSREIQLNKNFLNQTLGNPYFTLERSVFIYLSPNFGFEVYTEMVILHILFYFNMLKK